MSTIGIIIGSIRRGRKGSKIGEWIREQIADRNDADYRVMELADFDLPLLVDETVPAAADRNYDSPQRQHWGTEIDACDAFIFVTPEYNHGVPGALKNAFDCLGPEWEGKPIGFVSYGAASGVRAVEQWRQIVACFDMVDVRAEVTIPTYAEFGDDGSFTPSERRGAQFADLCDALVARC